MPYIYKQQREDVLTNRAPLNAGELNFLISDMCDKYIKRNGLSYTIINTLIGALECAKLELYRRIAGKYEDQKLFDNGEVYHNAVEKLHEPKQLELFPDTAQATFTGEDKYGETKFG